MPLKHWLVHLVAGKTIDRYKTVIDNYSHLCDRFELEITEQRRQILSLEEGMAHILANKATIYDKLSVTAHAVHRYRERHKGKGSDEELYNMLYKALVSQTKLTDTLPDGVYTLRKGIAYTVKDYTLVTVLPKRAARP